MGFFQSKSIFRSASKSDIINIIVIHSLMYVIFQFTRITFLIGGESDTYFYAHIYDKITLPAQWHLFIYKPWSIFTYIFADLNIYTFIANMIWLWIFGTVIEDLQGSYKVLPIYLISGFMGAIVFLSVNTLFFPLHQTSYAGALASLSGLAVCVLMFRPKYIFSAIFGLGIPIWGFALIYFALQSIMITSSTLWLLSLIVGGIITGLGYKSYFKSFFDLLSDFYKKTVGYLSNNDHFIKKKKSKLNISTHPRNNRIQNHKTSQLELNQLLDKIQQDGIDSLSASEKKRLDLLSKQL